MPKFFSTDSFLVPSQLLAGLRSGGAHATAGIGLRRNVTFSLMVGGCVCCCQFSGDSWRSCFRG